MEAKKKGVDYGSHLILPRTPREQLREITVITKGEGIRVCDQDGKSYLDLVAGVTRPVHVGYGRKEIAQAVYDQICQLSYFTPVQFCTIPAMKLAEVLAGIAPGDINGFFFVCDGSVCEALSSLQGG
jgi:adenosylmethionine-8-amino-7-oxononanoate aminotransferase